MPNEYNGTLLVLRDTSGTQMSLARFFQLALDDGDGHRAFPSQGKYSGFDPSHHAWDMATGGLAGIVPARTPVCGTVTGTAQTGWNGGMGSYVIVMDELGRQHRFMHLAENSIRVSVGDAVTQGNTLGLIGNTGRSTGAHLHYDVTVDGAKIDDPIDAYDCTTLPSGWNMVDAAAANNWDYIQLDDAATDYGPEGGDTPAEPFFTTKYIYDISVYQTAATMDALCADPDTGGFLIRFAWNGSQDASVASHYAKAKAAGIPVGFYAATSKNITADGSVAYRAMLEAEVSILFDTLGVRAKDCPLGIWLDLEVWKNGIPGGANSGVAGTFEDNLQQLQMFREVFTPKGYVVVGWYTYYAILNQFFRDTTDVSWKEYPFWYSRPGVSRSLVDSEMSQFGIHNCYLWQDGYPTDEGGYWSPDKTYTHRDVDNDTVLQPIPVAGGGGGGSYTEVINITVDIIPPKRIYFSPNPGIVLTDTDLLNERTATIELRTDADNATLWYTTDGSSPYVYTYNGDTTAYAVAANAIQYTEPVVINKDTHIRVVAAPTGIAVGEAFPEPLAKGSGTFLFQYKGVAQDWDAEKQAYAIQDGDASFFEENRQAFLLEHILMTPQEVLYADVYTHSEEAPGEDAEDNASTTSGTTPTIQPMG